jgi:hypothetical protein
MGVGQEIWEPGMAGNCVFLPCSRSLCRWMLPKEIDQGLIELSGELIIEGMASFNNIQK